MFIVARGMSEATRDMSEGYSSMNNGKDDDGVPLLVDRQRILVPCLRSLDDRQGWRHVGLWTVEEEPCALVTLQRGANVLLGGVRAMSLAARATPVGRHGSAADSRGMSVSTRAITVIQPP